MSEYVRNIGVKNEQQSQGSASGTRATRRSRSSRYEIPTPKTASLRVLSTIWSGIWSKLSSTPRRRPARWRCGWGSVAPSSRSGPTSRTPRRRRPSRPLHRAGSRAAKSLARRLQEGSWTVQGSPSRHRVRPQASRVACEVEQCARLAHCVDVEVAPRAQPDLGGVPPLGTRRGRVSDTPRAGPGLGREPRLRGGRPLAPSSASEGEKVVTTEERRPSTKTCGPSRRGSRCGSSWKKESRRRLSVRSRRAPTLYRPLPLSRPASAPMAGGSADSSKSSP